MADKTDSELRELTERYQQAMEAGDTREALLTADAMIVQLLTQVQDGHAIQQRDMQVIVMLLASTMRVLIHRELHDVSGLFRLF